MGNKQGLDNPIATMNKSKRGGKTFDYLLKEQCAFHPIDYIDLCQDMGDANIS